MATGKMKGKYVRIQMWNGGYRQACAVTTIKSLINNMFIGVTEVSLFEFFSHDCLQNRNGLMLAFGVYFSFSNYFSHYLYLIFNYNRGTWLLNLIKPIHIRCADFNQYVVFHL